MAFPAPTVGTVLGGGLTPARMPGLRVLGEGVRWFWKGCLSKFRSLVLCFYLTFRQRGSFGQSRCTKAGSRGSSRSSEPGRPPTAPWRWVKCCPLSGSHWAAAFPSLTLRLDALESPGVQPTLRRREAGPPGRVKGDWEGGLGRTGCWPSLRQASLRNKHPWKPKVQKLVSTPRPAQHPPHIPLLPEGRRMWLVACWRRTYQNLPPQVFKWFSQSPRCGPAPGLGPRSSFTPRGPVRSGQAGPSHGLAAPA